MHAAVLAALLLLSPVQAAPLVEDSVDLISVAHYDGASMVFFWGRCSGEWTCLAHRWASPDMAPRVSAEGFELAWIDDSEVPCYRVIRAPAYVETHEAINPLAEQNERPWFARLLEPGLKEPPKAN